MRRWVPVLAMAAWSCGGGTDVVAVASVEVTPKAWLVVGVGDTIRFRASAYDVDGRPVGNARPAWQIRDSAVAVVDQVGLVRAVAAGATRVVARLENVIGEATLEVYVPPTVASYEPGVSYPGRRAYVEYVPGTLPVVISVPHGGDVEPEEIPDRGWGTVVTDLWTRETATAVRDAFVASTGQAPHLVISHLKRTKLDPNREVSEAAQGSPFAENAWNEFHGFIDVAAAEVAESFGSGLYLDLHGHGHEMLRAELGYLLSAADLDLPDEVLDTGGFADRSSLRAVARRTAAPFSDLLRGPSSLGGLLATTGVAVVPSPPDPSPGAAPYFSGGYGTIRHGSRTSGTVSGVQIELPRTGVRDTEENRRAFAHALAQAVAAFMTTHWGFFAH